MGDDAPQKGNESPEPKGEWIGLAWRDYVRGLRDWTALGRKYNKHRDTVKRQLVKYSQSRAAERADGVDPTAEYLAGLEIDQEATTALYGTVANDNAKIGALKHRTETRKLIAAAQGVVTERSAQEQEKKGDETVLVKVVGLDRVIEIARNGSGTESEPDAD